MIVTRAVVAEFIQSIKFKCELAEDNYLALVNFVLQDFGETCVSAITYLLFSLA